MPLLLPALETIVISGSLVVEDEVGVGLTTVGAGQLNPEDQALDEVVIDAVLERVEEVYIDAVLERGGQLNPEDQALVEVVVFD